MSLRLAPIGGSLVACASLLFAAGASAQTTGDVPAARPDALIDLTRTKARALSKVNGDTATRGSSRWRTTPSGRI